MADPQIVNTLRRKRDAIEQAIANYEKKIEAAKLDLAHVNATLRLFESPDERTEFPVYVDTLRLFRRGEIVSICKKALAEEGPLDTRELALRVIRHKRLDEADTVLRTSITYRIVHALRSQWKRGRIESPPQSGMELDFGPFVRASMQSSGLFGLVTPLAAILAKKHILFARLVAVNQLPHNLKPIAKDFASLRLSAVRCKKQRSQSHVSRARKFGLALLPPRHSLVVNSQEARKLRLCAAHVCAQKSYLFGR